MHAHKPFDLLTEAASSPGRGSHRGVQTPSRPTPPSPAPRRQRRPAPELHVRSRWQGSEGGPASGGRQGLHAAVHPRPHRLPFLPGLRPRPHPQGAAAALHQGLQRHRALPLQARRPQPRPGRQVRRGGRAGKAWGGDQRGLHLHRLPPAACLRQPLSLRPRSCTSASATPSRSPSRRSSPWAPPTRGRWCWRPWCGCASCWCTSRGSRHSRRSGRGRTTGIT